MDFKDVKKLKLMKNNMKASLKNICTDLIHIWNASSCAFLVGALALVLFLGFIVPFFSSVWLKLLSFKTIKISCRPPPSFFYINVYSGKCLTKYQKVWGFASHKYFGLIRPYIDGGMYFVLVFSISGHVSWFASSTLIFLLIWAKSFLLLAWCCFSSFLLLYFFVESRKYEFVTTSDSSWHAFRSHIVSYFLWKCCFHAIYLIVNLKLLYTLLIWLS